MEQLTELSKILDGLESIEDKDKTLLLLCALPISFDSFKDIMLYGKDVITTLDEAQTALRTKELTESNNSRVNDSREGLSNVKRWRQRERGKETTN